MRNCVSAKWMLICLFLFRANDDQSNGPPDRTFLTQADVTDSQLPDIGSIHLPGSPLTTNDPMTTADGITCWQHFALRLRYQVKRPISSGISVLKGQNNLPSRSLLVQNLCAGEINRCLGELMHRRQSWGVTTPRFWDGGVVERVEGSSWNIIL